MNISKILLAKKVSEEIGISKLQSKIFLDAFIALIINNVDKNDVKFNGFGTFYRHQTPKRIGRNPKTKESYIIEPRTKVNLKTSKKIRDILN